MALTREQSLRIRNFLDNWLPPVLRDSKLFMYPLLFLAFGSRFREFADFKSVGFSLSREAFSGIYERTADLQKVQGETDLNEACVQAILHEVVGDNVIDVGCGRGYLVDKLASKVPQVTGCDIVLGPELVTRPGVQFKQGSAEHLPFPDRAFHTVVCTHTLEHVQDLASAIRELRRIADRRLIIVVPRERPYRYSFNLHLHFFPYPWNLQAVLGASPRSSLRDLGDWFYVEEVT